MKIFLVEAILNKANPMKDGGMSLGFQTNEMTHEEKVLLMEKLNSFGWLAFKENEINTGEMPNEDAEDKNKTPSRRLRAVLYVLSQQQGIKQENFELFYREKMEKIISWVKTKLD